MKHDFLFSFYGFKISHKIKFKPRYPCVKGLALQYFLYLDSSLSFSRNTKTQGDFMRIIVDLSLFEGLLWI